MKENKNWKKTDRLISDQPEPVDVRFVSSGFFDRLVYFESGFWITLSILLTLITPAVFLSPLALRSI